MHVFTYTSCRLAAMPSKQTALQRAERLRGRPSVLERACYGGDIYIHTQLWDQPLRSNYLPRMLEAHRAVEKRQQRCPSPVHIRSLEFGPHPRQSAGSWSKHCALYSTPGQTHNNLYKIYGLNNEWEKHFEVIGCAQVPISPPGELVCTKQHKLNNWCTMQRRSRIALIWNMLRVAVLCRWWQSLFRKTKNVLIEREREKERESASFFHHRRSKPNLQRPDYWFMEVSALQQQ